MPHPGVVLREKISWLIEPIKAPRVFKAGLPRRDPNRVQTGLAGLPVAKEGNPE
jgi:hypothetical protein